MYLFSCLLCVSSFYGVMSQTLTQSSSEVKKPGERLKMSCIGSGFNFARTYIHWAHQPPRGGMTWIGWIYGDNGRTGYNSAFQGRFTMTADKNINTVYLDIGDLKVEDTATYYCAKEESQLGAYFDKWGPGTFVTVTSAEKRAPSVFPLIPCSGSLSTSQYITFGCLSTNYLPPPVDVTWNSGSITNGIRNFPSVLGKSGTYLSSSLLTVSAQDYKDKKYTCNVNHKATGQTINKDVEVVEEEPKAPTVEVTQASCGETGSVDLVCWASGYSPNIIEIQWLLNGEPTSVYPKNSTPYKDNDGTFGLRSEVSVPSSDWNAGDIYTCRAKHPASSTKNEDRISKCTDSSSGGSHPKVTLLPPSPKEMLINKQPKVSCDVSKLDSTESLRITWTRSDGKKSVPFTSDPKRDSDGKWIVRSSLRISVADWNSKGTFTCKVQHNDLPTPIEKQIQKRDVESADPTIYIYPPTKEELNGYDFVSITGFLTGFSHKDIYVQWKKNGQVIDEDYYINTEPVKDEDNDTYIMYSRLTIEKSDWLRESVFTCSGVLNNITSKEIKIEKCRGK